MRLVTYKSLYSTKLALFYLKFSYLCRIHKKTGSLPKNLFLLKKNYHFALMNNKNINKTIKLIPVHLVFWLLIWLFYSFYFGFKSQNESYIFWFSSVLMPVTIANTYLTIYYLIPKYLIPKKYKLFILYLIYVLIATAWVLSILMFFGFVYMSELDFKSMPPLSSNLPFVLMSMYLIIFIVSSIVLVQYNYKALEKNKTLENKFLITKLQLKEEELKFLKMQIHPHFLFNTLNTMYGFALKKADETPEMILKLSNLLDYILYQIDKPKVLLTKEIDHIKDYIDLEKMRFSDTLNVTLRANNIDNTFEVAPMLLIPFVENSFKHGNLINDCLTINIEIHTNKNSLHFKISNTFISQNKDNKGIGLENINKRLEMLYPNKYILIINQSNNIFEVNLKIEKDV